MEAGNNEDRIYELHENNIEYMTHIQGDTDEDDTLLQQIVHLEDDIESIVDEEHYARIQRGEQDIMDEGYNIPDSLRQCQARDRQGRREERAQTRFKGTKEELKKMRDAL
eukprot:5773523-Amphidinium_carterae.1